MRSKPISRLSGYLSRVIFALVFSTTALIVNAENLAQAYLDKHRNVHIVTAHGQHVQLTRKGKAEDLKLSPDHRTVAWRRMIDFSTDGQDLEISDELVVYRDEKITSLRGGPLIRDYWFRKNGDQLAVECGGLHFAGFVYLYDTATRNEIVVLDEGEVPLEKRMDWANGDN